jgi:kynurenine formamidase
MTRIIDLSQGIETGQPVYPGLAKTLINTWNTYEETARVQGQGLMDRLYTTCSIFISDHCATHIDALVHFGQRPFTAEQIPLELCYARGVALDFSHKKPGEYIRVEDLDQALQKIGFSINPGDVVLMHTGASEYWGDPRYFSYIVPVHADAVRLLFEQGVRIIGVDAITIDIDPTYPAHVLAKELDYYHIENLTNIKEVVGKRFQFAGFPLKLVGASGAPMRAVAILED